MSIMRKEAGNVDVELGSSRDLQTTYHADLQQCGLVGRCGHVITSLAEWIMNYARACLWVYGLGIFRERVFRSLAL